jgi:hypothetical protein
MLPRVRVFWDAAPVKVDGVAVALVVEFPLAVVATARVVFAAVVAAGTVALVETAGAWVPVTRTAAAVVAPEATAVVNATWGTVTAVEMTTVLDEDGMMEPERDPVVSVHGTTVVVKMEMVVTGTVAADVVATPAEVAVVETLGQRVTIAGLDGI